MHLWGENGQSPSVAAPVPAQSADASIRDPDDAPVHPFAADPATLRDLLGDLSADALLATVAQASTLRLRLPATHRGPVPSPWTGKTDRHPTSPPAQLADFTVPTLAFTPAQAVDLLTSLPQPAPDSCADSVRFWSRLARFVLSALTHRQFYPDVETNPDGSLRAVWRVTIASHDELAWLERLTSAMPPACRAVTCDPECRDAARLVESFLMASADAIIRRDLANDAFFHDIYERGRASGASPDLQWVSALLGQDPIIRLRGESPAQFLEHVRAWTGRMDLQRTLGATRLILTLHEPADPSDEDDAEPPAPHASDPTWTITFQLQSLDEDVPPIDAEELFADPGQPSRLLGRQIADRRVQFLSHLTSAAAIFPPLERILNSPAPTRLELNTSEAHLFLSHWSTQLVEHGYGVVLPQWVTRREVGLQLVVHPHDEDDSPIEPPDPLRFADVHASGATRFGLDTLLDFDWRIAVGDLTLTPQEFRQLAESHTPLVRYRGQWIQLDLNAAQRAIGFIERQPRGRATLADAIRIAFFPQDAGLPILGLRGTGWLEYLLNQAPTYHLQPVQQPRGFAGTLRPYQLRGLDWLSFLARLGIGGCLADDMGLGKTIQMIALLLSEREQSARSAEQESSAAPDNTTQPESRGDGNGSNPAPQSSTAITHRPDRPNTNHSPGPTLIFAPTSVVSNWKRELERFAPNLRVMVHHGPDRLRGDAFVAAANEHDVVLTTYALAHRDIDDLCRPRWWRIALDEAQKIKNPNSASALAIRALRAPQRVALTGTPIENRLSELWSIMEVLNPGLLGSAAEFRERFAVPIEKLRDAERSGHLRRMIQPFVLRRTKNDPQVAADLPEKLETKVYCNLTAEQAAWYERITAEMLGQIDSASGIRRRGLILAALTRLKQVCDHPELVVNKYAGRSLSRHTEANLDRRSGKCERPIEMLEEVLAEGDAALVFTQYREMGHLLEQLITQRLRVRVQFLHGGTPAKQRDEMVMRFNAPGSDVRIFLLSLRAGGLGLNLTAANHVFHFDRWWNPAVEAQATDRAHRIGQTRKVQVHKFICVGTMEERIDRMLSEKLALAEQIVGTGDEWLTNLSTEQLREYLSLSREAVGEY